MLIDTYTETGLAWRRPAVPARGIVDAIALRLILTPALIASADEDGMVAVYLYPADMIDGQDEPASGPPPDLRAYVKAAPIDTDDL